MAWLETIVWASLLALFIITFIGRSYIVDSASMENTLHDRQRVIVDKISYWFVEPSRGEIIILDTPLGAYVKRIIAVGGDTIEERNGVIFLNGEPTEEPYVTN